MLGEKNITYVYREYSEDKLSRDELEELFTKLARRPRDLLRRGEAKEFRVAETDSDAEVLDKMAVHPTLLQRPILVNGAKAALGRPVENLLSVL